MVKESFKQRQPDSIDEENIQPKESLGIESTIGAIAAEYEARHPTEQLGVVKAEYLTLADVLLRLEEDRKKSFVDIVVDKPVQEVLNQLQQTRIGEGLLSREDDQLAIEVVDDDYYPTLDVRKNKSELTNVGVRVWGWGSGEFIDRTIELELFYSQQGLTFTEVVGLNMTARNDRCSAQATGSIVMTEYAEQGYEGHNFKTLYAITDEDIAEFTNLIHYAVGETPESFNTRNGRVLSDVMNRAATPEAKEAMQILLERTWTEQALYVLTKKQEDTGISIAQMAADPGRASEAVHAIVRFLSEWPTPIE